MWELRSRPPERRNLHPTVYVRLKRTQYKSKKRNTNLTESCLVDVIDYLIYFFNYYLKTMSQKYVWLGRWGCGSVERGLAKHAGSPGLPSEHHINWLWWTRPAIPAMKRQTQDQKIRRSKSCLATYWGQPGLQETMSKKKKKISEESYTALSLQGTLSKRRSNWQNTFPEERAVSQTGICGHGVFMESPIIYSNSKSARPVDTGAQWHYPKALHRIWWCWTLLTRIKLGSSKMASDSGLHSLSSSVLGFVESRHIPGMWGVIYRSVYNSQCLHHWRKSLSLSQAAIKLPKRRAASQACWVLRTLLFM